ncbi:MAG TPA: PilT/PilU family type 4a pilus ATPase [Candidatus Sulfotelmatobacter sp.]|nr:PilT/PilU family type 4a pilus ATPase [Candidatus Sulfotelmatobacter sp.]
MQRHELDRILTRMLDAYGPVSDLNFTTGRPPQVERSGELVAVEMDPPLPRLTPFQTEAVTLALIGGDRRLTETLVRTGSCDLPYALGTRARFRVNIFQQRGSYSIVLRRLASEVPTIARLNLPPIFTRMAQERNGLILVTGATGSGKSTTLAAILDVVNETKAVHVVTLEDPVEFVHPVKKATFNQRELGTDFDAFAGGLRAALRQAPKIILVGEMRDRETLEIGLSAAETGHLVLSTLHTVDAGQTVNRILGMFDKDEERMLRMRLANTLRWVVGQRLLPKVGGGRVAAFEIMGMNIRIEEIILSGESEGKTFYEIIQDSEALGMQTFDTHILRLFKEGVITEETALSYASKRSTIARGLDTIKATKGEKTSDIEGLALDTEYSKIPDPRTRSQRIAAQPDPRARSQRMPPFTR